MLLASPSTVAAAAACWLLAAATTAACAQTMAPGLWEQQTTVKLAGAQADGATAKLQQELAKMPPEQRKMMEEMMARRGVGAGAKPNTVRVCVSKEQAERGELPQQNDGHCQRETVQRSGASVKFKFACSTPPSRGEGEFTMTGSKAYSGHTTATATVRGKPEQVEMQMSGQWIGADCGGVAPAGKR